MNFIGFLLVYIAAVISVYIAINAAPKKKPTLKEIQKELDSFHDIGRISDGYHTFNELYEFRLMYNAHLFNLWHEKGLYDVHKSYLHHDGEKCFGKEDTFIVTAQTPHGQISNHYKSWAWDYFKIPEEEKAKHMYDGHTPKDVLKTLKKLTNE